MQQQQQQRDVEVDEEDDGEERTLGEEKIEYATVFGASVAIIRCMVGPAALYMPHGFAMAGLCGGLVMIVIANTLFYLGVSRLLLCWRELAGRPEAATMATLAHHLGGPWCRLLVQFSIVSLQAGVCTTYFIFIDETLREILADPPSSRTVVFVTVLIEASASTVRSVQSLTGPNLLGNCLVAISLAVICGYAISLVVGQGRGPHPGWRCTTTPSDTIVFAGTAVFAFEGGASIVVPVANSVAPRDRDKVASVTFRCVLVVAAAYAVFASTVYLAYGPDVEVIASRSLQGDGFWPRGAVNFVYLLVALVTFPLQLLPASQILFGDDDLSNRKYRHYVALSAATSAAPRNNNTNNNNTIAQQTAASSAHGRYYDNDNHHGPPSSPHKYRECAKLRGDACRVALVVLLGAVALAGRHSLDHVISLLGALSCAPLALIVGPWCHLALAPTTFHRRLDIFVIAVGLVVTVLTLALTLTSWRSAQS